MRNHGVFWVSGFSGANGAGGLSGATGASGVNGSNGATGASGFTGATGSAINAVTGTGVAGWIPYWNSTSTIASSSGQSVYIGTVTTTSSSLQPFIVKGVASQSANLLEIQNSSSTILNSVDPNGNAYFADGQLSRFSATTIVATTSRNFTQSDNGASIVSTAASAITLTIPTGLAVGFNCSIVQKGAGQVTVGSGTGVSGYAPDGAKSGKQWAMMSVLNTGISDEYVVGGNVTA